MANEQSPSRRMLDQLQARIAQRRNLPDDVAQLAEETNDVVARQRKVVEKAKGANDPMATNPVNRATAATKKAADKARELTDKVKAAKPVTAAELAEVSEAIRKARTDQDKAIKALGKIVSDHDRILRPHQEGEDSSRPPSRLDDIEAQIVGLGSVVDQSASASAEALAVARASSGGNQPPVWLVGLAALIVGLLGWGVVDVFWDVDYFWDAVLWSVGIAIFTMAVLGLVDLLNGPTRQGYAEGRAQARTSAETRRHEAEGGDQTEYASVGR